MQVETIELSSLKGKTIAIDAFNTLYQFLSTIRQADGTPLSDTKGRVTSHLSGMFYRNLNLLEQGIRPVYVFDGESPVLKEKEVIRRREIRDAAHEEWQKAKREGRTEDALKAAKASSRLTSDMIEETKALLSALGIPYIEAPSEGEALAAQMSREKIVWASASQDYDSLLYNCPRMVRNLSVTGKRTSTRSKSPKTVHPEIIDLDLNLRLLGISREQLIDIAMLVGTDYNDKVPRFGPPTALKFIKEHGSLEDAIAQNAIEVEFPYEEIRNIFLNPPHASLKTPQWSSPDDASVKKILCAEHSFSVSRVEASLERLAKSLGESKASGLQQSLTDYF
jgi:flap endonuclease-1